MIEIQKAPPFATVQDLGWRSGRAIGLPPGGAMDRGLLRAANRLVGNPPDSAVIEWALGPGALRFDTESLVGALDDAEVRLDGKVQRGAVTVPSGALLEIIPGQRQRFVYLAVRGGIDVPEIMGSRSTYLPGALGGFEGRRLKSGDRLPVGTQQGPAPVTPDETPRPHHGGAVPVLRVTRGPQWDRFAPEVRARYFEGEYTITPASDRMGYRLTGPGVAPRETATLPSEAACPGAVQVPDDGQPIVLMPDGPTVGGYPKLAVVVRQDLGVLAQCHPGRRVRFREIDLTEARRSVESRA